MRYCDCLYCKLFTSDMELRHRWKTPFTKIWWAIPRKIFSDWHEERHGDWLKIVPYYKYWYIDFQQGQTLPFFWFVRIKRLSNLKTEFDRINGSDLTK